MGRWEDEMIDRRNKLLEIMGKWEDEIIGRSVNPVRKDRALTPPFL